MRKAITIGIALYLAIISIIGVCDTLNNGVEKRAQAQEVRTERLEKNQAELEEQVERQRQKTEDALKKQQANHQTQ